MFQEFGESAFRSKLNPNGSNTKSFDTVLPRREKAGAWSSGQLPGPATADFPGDWENTKDVQAANTEKKR
jgi:hypothetical protein